METTARTPTVWPALRYNDAQQAIAFLKRAFGFEESAVYPGESPGSIVHAELLWSGGGGGVMLGSTRADDLSEVMQPGMSSIYVVTDEPDALFERATGAGAEVVRGLTNEDYGSRGFTVRDPEGNLWSFGTYGGA